MKVNSCPFCGRRPDTHLPETNDDFFWIECPLEHLSSGRSKCFQDVVDAWNKLTKTKEVKLNACPFCGGKCEVRDSSPSYEYSIVLCPSCKAKSVFCGSELIAAAEWNSLTVRKEETK